MLLGENWYSSLLGVKGFGYIFELLQSFCGGFALTTRPRSDQGGQRLGYDTSASEQKGLMQWTRIQLWATDQNGGEEL